MSRCCLTPHEQYLSWNLSVLSAATILRLSRVCPVASTSYTPVTVLICHLIARIECMHSMSGCCLSLAKKYLNWKRTFFICSCNLKVIKSCPVASTSYKRVTVVLCHLIASVACVYYVNRCCLTPNEQYLNWNVSIFYCSWDLKVNTSLISRSELVQKCHHVIWPLHANIKWVDGVNLRVSKFEHQLKTSLLYL